MRSAEILLPMSTCIYLYAATCIDTFVIKQYTIQSAAAAKHQFAKTIRYKIVVCRLRFSFLCQRRSQLPSWLEYGYGYGPLSLNMAMPDVRTHLYTIYI